MRTYSPDSISYDTARYTEWLGTGEDTPSYWVCPLCGESHDREHTVRTSQGYDVHEACMTAFTYRHLDMYEAEVGPVAEDIIRYREDFDIALADELFDRIAELDAEAEARGEQYFYSL